MKSAVAAQNEMIVGVLGHTRTESRPLPAESRPPSTESQPLPTGTRPPPTGTRPPPTGTRPLTESRPLPIESRSPSTESRPPSTESQPEPSGLTERSTVVRRRKANSGESSAREAHSSIVAGKPKVRSSTVFGKATGIAIRAATKRSKFANVFASRLDPLLTSDDLSNYLHGMLKLRPTVLLVKAIKHYIQCECDNPVVFLSDTIWPEGSLVRWWREPQADNSRASRQADSSESPALTPRDIPVADSQLAVFTNTEVSLKDSIVTDNHGSD